MGISFFEAFFEEKLSWGNTVHKQRDFNVPMVLSQAVNLLAMHKFVEKCLAKATATQAKYYNKKHLSCSYNVGKFVYLNSKNINLTQSTKKLDWKYYEPYKIFDHIGK